MMFQVGQKVVCVDDQFDHRAACDPIKGKIYIVARAGVYNGIPVIALEGVHPPIGWLDVYRARRFRPVVEKKTDISIFTALLNTKQRENVLCGND